MKLIRFGEVGKEKPGVQLENGTRLDVSAFGTDYNEDFFGTDGIDRVKDWLAKNEGSCPVVEDSVRLGARLVRPSKIVCVGINYAKHAAESGIADSTEPAFFFKATSAMVGPNDDQIIPENSVKSHGEVELAVVIGKKASYVSKQEALDHVAGYVVPNDY